MMAAGAIVDVSIGPLPYHRIMQQLRANRCVRAYRCADPHLYLSSSLGRLWSSIALHIYWQYLKILQELTHQITLDNSTSFLSV